MLYVKAYSGALLAFLALDALWLGLLAKGFYISQMGDLLRDKPQVLAAGLFYCGYVGGIVYFAIAPAMQAVSPLRSAAFSGALLGLMAYGAYDMTNYATLKNWPLAIVVVDIVWGMVVSASAAACGYAATRL